VPEAGDTASVEVEPAGARCAQHPEDEAVLTCARCGDFACSACADALGSQPRCKRCGIGQHEVLRRELGSHERLVRVGALYLAVFGMVTCAFALVKPIALSLQAGDYALYYVSRAVPLAGGALWLCAGWQAQRFTRLGQVLATVTCLLGLWSVPLGTMLGASLLWILHGKQGRAVFSARYRTAMAATPQLDFRVPILTNVALALLFGLTAMFWLNEGPR
jgi:hypothetical protein